MLEPLILEGNNRLPSINFDSTKGVLEFSGRSIPDNALGFYKPLYEWLDIYKNKPHSLTQVNIKFEYFNTSSSKCLFEIFKSLIAMHDAGHEIVINWYYLDDDDQLETGQDFQSIVKIPFNLILVSK